MVVGTYTHPGLEGGSIYRYSRDDGGTGRAVKKEETANIWSFGWPKPTLSSVPCSSLSRG